MLFKSSHAVQDYFKPIHVANELRREEFKTQKLNEKRCRDPQADTPPKLSERQRQSMPPRVYQLNNLAPEVVDTKRMDLARVEPCGRIHCHTYRIARWAHIERQEAAQDSRNSCHVHRE
jgi:hypothetical protein